MRTWTHVVSEILHSHVTQWGAVPSNLARRATMKQPGHVEGSDKPLSHLPLGPAAAWQRWLVPTRRVIVHKLAGVAA